MIPMGSRILKRLKQHYASEDFMEPVDYISLGLLDYPRVIKRPMDLKSVTRRL